MQSTKSLLMARWSAIGALAAYLPGEVFFVAMAEADSRQGLVLFVTSTWTAILAVACSTSLVIGQNRYLRRPIIDPRQAGIAIGGGLFSGAIAGFLAEAVFQAAVAVGRGNLLFVEASRIVAWGIFGSLTGVGMSFVIPNLGQARGALAGLIGGAVGGIGFILGGVFLDDSIGRLVGMTILGGALGFAIGLVEEAARVAWLEVGHGRSRETVRVSLGAEPVAVGSNSQRCAVWAQGARPIALRFRYRDGNVLCDDIATERTTVVEPGSEFEVGNVRLVVRVGAGQVGAGVASKTPTSTPPPPPSRGPTPPPPPPPRVATPSRPAPPIRPQASRPPGTPPASRPVSGRPPPPPPPPPRR